MIFVLFAVITGQNNRLALTITANTWILNETGKTTISKYPLFQQLKEVTTGTPDQVGIMSLLPVVRNLKIARFVNPFISPIEKLHSKIFHEESSDESPK